MEWQKYVKEGSEGDRKRDVWESQVIEMVR